MERGGGGQNKQTNKQIKRKREGEELKMRKGEQEASSQGRVQRGMTRIEEQVSKSED